MTLAKVMCKYEHFCSQFSGNLKIFFILLLTHCVFMIIFPQFAHLFSVLYDCPHRLAANFYNLQASSWVINLIAYEVAIKYPSTFLIGHMSPWQWPSSGGFVLPNLHCSLASLTKSYNNLAAGEGKLSNGMMRFNETLTNKAAAATSKTLAQAFVSFVFVLSFEVEFFAHRLFICCVHLLYEHENPRFFLPFHSPKKYRV